MKLKTLSVLLTILLVCQLNLVVLVHAQSTTFTISQGVYPQATFTVWMEGSMCYAKDHYGAIKFSGSAPSTVINNAINALTAGRTFIETILIKGNIILKSGSIVPKNYTCLEIEGKITAHADLENHLINAGASDAYVQDVIIRGGELDGNKDEQTAGVHCIRFTGARRIRIENMYIHNAKAYGIGLQGNAVYRDVVISNVIIENTGNDAIDIKNISGSNKQIFIDNVDITDFGQDGVEETGIDVRGQVVLNNIQIHDIQQYDVGIRFRSLAEGDAERSCLSNFRMSSSASGGYGLVVGANWVEISNGQIEGTSIGISVRANHTTISNVIVRTTSSYGIEFDTTKRCSLHAIVEGSSTTGCYLDDSVEVTVSGIYCSNGGYGIESVGSSDYVIIDNAILRDNTSGTHDLVGANNVIGDIAT